MTDRRSAVLAAVLSFLLPGAGQWFVGNRPTAVALMCTTLGVWSGAAVSLWGPAPLRSTLTVWVLAVIYPFVGIPAVVDAWQTARGEAAPLLSGHQRWYVILMLLTVGPLSLPLLWQNPRFSRSAKLGWTAFVILVFISGVLLAVLFLPWLERTLRNFGVWPS